MALNQKTGLLTIKYQNNDFKVFDQVSLSFFDATYIRIIPTSPEVRNGSVDFKLYRRDGIDFKNLRIVVEDGTSIPVEMRSITSSVVSVAMKVPEGIGFKDFVIQVGSERLNLPLKYELEK